MQIFMDILITMATKLHKQTFLTMTTKLSHSSSPLQLPPYPSLSKITTPSRVVTHFPENVQPCVDLCVSKQFQNVWLLAFSPFCQCAKISIKISSYLKWSESIWFWHLILNYVENNQKTKTMQYSKVLRSTSITDNKLTAVFNNKIFCSRMSKNFYDVLLKQLKKF